MKINILSSTSDGNACRIFNERTSILLDCGLSKTKLFMNGFFPVDGIFVTHAHSDHTKGIGVIGRHSQKPIFLQKDVHQRLQNSKSKFFHNCVVEFIENAQSVTIGDFQITAHPTCHDGIGGLFFTVLEIHSGLIYGHLTDTGIYTNQMVKALQTCDGLLLEANHDLDLLDEYPGYPTWLKERIKCDTGHLSNEQTLEFIGDHLDLNRLQWITFGHLSPRTNHPDLILKYAKLEFSTYKKFYVAPIELNLN